jgi:hypothetical protein
VTRLGFSSGWRELAGRYPDRDEPARLELGWRSGTMGERGVAFKGVLALAACPSGLRVSIWRGFGPFCPPFLAPWGEIRAERAVYAFTEMARLSFGNPAVGSLTISAEAWRRLSSAAGLKLAPELAPAPEAPNARLLRTLFLQWIAAMVVGGLVLQFAPLVWKRAPALPTELCVLFPALVFGVAQAVRFLSMRRR